MLPEISIVVPSFNAFDTIERTLASLIDQGYPRLQLIVMDGASTDGTQAVIERYTQHIDCYVSEQDKSQSDALNKGFRLASGQCLGWLCADDELAPGALLKVGEFFEQNPEIDVFTGGCLRIFPEGENVTTSPSEDYVTSLYLKNTIEQPSTFWRRRVYERIGLLNETMKYAFDWEYWCRMKAAGFEFARTESTLSVYHFSETNLTSTGGRAIVDEMYRIVREFGPYKGRLAWAYQFLYRCFDLRGFYDDEAKAGRGFRTTLFHLVLRALYAIYDRESINTYNWNFASRQERGIGW